MTHGKFLSGFVVLVVDDDADNREAVARVISDFGCSVLTASCSDDAFQIINSGARVDLVFSDVVMPDGDGLTLARLVRALSPDLPVVLTTGFTTVVEDVAQSGGVALIKPYSIERLEAVLREQLHTERDPKPPE